MLDAYVDTKSSSMLISSPDHFSVEVKDSLYIDTDLLLPDEFAKEVGFKSVVVAKGVYPVKHYNNKSDVIVSVRLK